MNSTRQATTYKKLVGKINDEYYFLDDIFDYGDGFKGATGYSLRPISKEEYDERTDPDNLKDYLKEHWQMAVAADQTESSLDDWVEMAINIDGAEEIAFDTSGWHGEEWDQLRKLGLSEEEYPVFEWSSGGRCFSKGMQFDKVYAPDLIELINKAEANS